MLLMEITLNRVGDEMSCNNVTKGVIDLYRVGIDDNMNPLVTDGSGTPISSEEALDIMRICELYIIKQERIKEMAKKIVIASHKRSDD
jgi:hypothetical protein